MKFQHLLKKLFVILWVTLCNIGYCDRLQFIEAPKSFLGNKDPTTIYTFSNNNARATIIFFPGGEGSFRVNENIRYNPGQPRMLKMIADAGYNVVFVDNPYPLVDSGPSGYPAMRAHDDYLDRIDSVLKYHLNQNLPIWLMGHSNGSFTVSTFIRRLQKENRLKEIDGIILSGTRNFAKFQGTLDTSIVFIHHEKDGCFATQYQDAVNNYNKVKLINKGTTDFFTITEGNSLSSNPCHTGYHMFHDAYPQVVQNIVSKLP